MKAILQGTIRVQPDDVEAAQAAIDVCIAATRKEAGCEVYAIVADPGEPGTFVISERWSSKEDLARHGEQPHLTALRTALGELGAETHLDSYFVEA